MPTVLGTTVVPTTTAAAPTTVTTASVTTVAPTTSTAAAPTTTSSLAPTTTTIAVPKVMPDLVGQQLSIVRAQLENTTLE